MELKWNGRKLPVWNNRWKNRLPFYSIPCLDKQSLKMFDIDIRYNTVGIYNTKRFRQLLEGLVPS